MMDSCFEECGETFSICILYGEECRVWQQMDRTDTACCFESHYETWFDVSQPDSRLATTSSVQTDSAMPSRSVSVDHKPEFHVSVAVNTTHGPTESTHLCWLAVM